ncbi:MAG: tetratricopeptide repeat protein [Thermoanaerobaculia bacterium]
MRFSPALRALSAAAVLACSNPAERNAAAVPRNLLLITLDTLRADHVGAYGDAAATTPALDRLAREGIRFRHAVAAVPLTLPSHATILTGLLPLHHCVRQNGGLALPADLPTLAGAFARRGARTGGFVGAYVLDRRFGLGRDFAVYDDEIERRPNEAQALEAERAGSVVVDRALAWLEAGGEAPFFAWVHLYDAHAPYAPAEPFRSRFPGQPYDGEIAAVDAQVARLLDWLDRRALGERTVVMVVGDHGEGLGDHGETTHGLLLYEPTLAVPWIVRAPGALAAGRVVEEPVSTADVAPTAAALAGVALGEAPGRPLDGRDLAADLAAGREPRRREIYSETEYPRWFGWATLAALRAGPAKWIAGPAPELYDLASDPGERRNRLADDRRTGHDLAARLATLQTTAVAAPAAAALDSEARARLASLGYLAGSAPAARHDARNPRDMVGLFHELERAKELLDGGRFAEAARQLEPIAAADPGNPVFAGTLAQAYRRGGELARSVPLYRQAVAANPEDVEGWYNLATALREAGETEEAIAVLGEAIRRDPAHPDAHNALGIALLDRGKVPEAAREFRRATELDPRNATAFTNLGNALRGLGQPDAAEAAYRRATELAPRFADPWNGLGALAVERDRPAEAIPFFDRALELAPRQLEIGFNRAIAWELAGDRERAAAGYRQFLAAADADPEYAAQREAARKLLARLANPASAGSGGR